MTTNICKVMDNIVHGRKYIDNNNDQRPNARCTPL